MRHGMEQFSINMFWLALAASAMATLLYWGHAFGVRLALRRLATNGQSLNVASWERLPASIGQAATLVGWLVVVFLAVALVARWRATGHAPWSNMWEYTVAFAGGTALAYAAFERWYGQRTLGAFVQPVVLGLLATAAAFFPSDVRPLVPALRNEPLLTAHVAMMVLAYSALSISFGAAVVYLVQGEKSRFLRLPRAEVLEEVGADAVRFFLLSRSADSQMDFDLELAKKQSADNPVYYIQYAHARIASILRVAQERGADGGNGDVSLLTSEPELTLIRKMLLLPEIVETIARTLEPHHLTYYAQDLATVFHSFYKQCRVVSNNAALTQARLKLVKAAKTVLGRTLNLMGMTAPDRM